MILFILLSCSNSPQAREETAFASYEDGETSRNAADDRMITYSVSMELSVKNPDETRRSIVEQIKQKNGFIVRETENLVTTRIPAENMDDFLSNIRELGKIENETRTGTDITDQYRDNVIRLDSLKNVRNRYLALLERADNVRDILVIEKELERVNLEIERLEGRIKQAELSVAYSIITVRFKERVKPGPVSWIFYGLFHGIKWLFVWN
jgi:hypothetical protein